MPDPRDGTYKCQTCQTPLNEDDRSCWKCGGTPICLMAPEPAQIELWTQMDRKGWYFVTATGRSRRFGYKRTPEGWEITVEETW